MRIVDAHQHFWDISRNYHPWLCDPDPIPFRYGDYAALRRPYLPGDYRADAGRHEVVGSVYVEAEHDPGDPLGEVAWVSHIARAQGLPTVIVAQAWLDRPDRDEVLAAHGAHPLVRGIRHKPAASATPQAARRGAPGSMDDPRWREGFAMLAGQGLSFDLQTPWWHLDAACDLARDFPETQIILNHAGLPADRSAEGLAQWDAALRRLAGAPNVALKISGLGVPGQPWRIEDNRAIVLAAIDAFTPQRVMFASNFPVDSLVAGFDTIIDGFDRITRGFAEAARAAMFRDTARRIYRMEHA
ncbi:amidohydrolase family protein [Pseudoponticoccus marisrubri]|uniref:Thioesterase n=1 Tax=Pseudoponticoccus marisrubri TaxID=1685382 RepID=A0A0W7WML1_9RHOB|nr:amidohydrolase family protein [Pseudoponticoccus marisrubri]KUF11833.1 thioesterase [Pseudoponticoccus marisrubri]